MPAAILNKRRELSAKEQALVASHAEIGAAMVADLGDPELTAAVRHHHERFDGGGYPFGLAGRRIPFAARLVAVVDTFDALTSSRPYRRASSRRALLDREAGSSTEAGGELSTASSSPLGPPPAATDSAADRLAFGPVSRRGKIVLSESELADLLTGERVAIVSNLGPRGWPHSMPLWFVPRAGRVWIWTYAKSQKVRNLERDPRATLLVETGHEYGELRGAMIEAEAVIHRAPDVVLGFAEELTRRYADGLAALDGQVRSGLAAQAPKRVAVEFVPLRTATWDHRKLGGTY